MTSRQLSEKIGNIDERFVLQALEDGAETKPARRSFVKRFVIVAAMISSMIFGGAVGALAFSEEKIVEVSASVESIEIEEIDLTLMLPDDWKGRYALEKNEWGEYVVYNPKIRENFGSEFGGGMLFYIVKIDEVLSPEQIENSHHNYAGNRYLFATEDSTYLLYYASDQQCTLEDYEEYDSMCSRIKDIKIVVENILE